MAVSSMQAVNIIGLTAHIDEVITVLGESGVFHPDEVGNFYKNLQDFTHLQSKNSYAEPLANLKSALNLTKREFAAIDVSDYSPTLDELETRAETFTSEIDTLVNAVEESGTRVEDTERLLSISEHFSGLDMELDRLIQLKYMKARFGKMPLDSLQKLEAYKDDDFIDFVVSAEDNTHCWGVYFAPHDKAEEIV